jgi:ABC-type Fe2+-enterobactin transport system substrate-binding protein
VRVQYSDNYYVASILRALGNTTSTEQQAQERIVKQIERYLDLEKMVPCYHNTITVACLQVRTPLIFAVDSATHRSAGTHDHILATRLCS